MAGSLMWGYVTDNVGGQCKGAKSRTLQSQHAIQVYFIALQETMVFFHSSAAVS